MHAHVEGLFSGALLVLTAADPEAVVRLHVHHRRVGRTRVTG